MLGGVAELNYLNELYGSEKFELLVIYSRKRAGKTTLLQEFSKHTNAIFFPAREKNDALGLEDSSKTIQLYSDQQFISSFKSWEDTFVYIGNKIQGRTALIIDEFPYITEENPSVKSLLQHAIGHSWKNESIFLVLYGSSVGVMKNEIMGRKSPLRDRRTATLEIIPFDYLESSNFFPNYSNEDKLIVYGILGNIPRYLETFDTDKSIGKNIVSRIVRNGSYLYEEPENLLKAELRETNTYNSILSAIANGRNRVIGIAGCIYESRTKVSKYLATLQALRLIEERVSCDEDGKSKRSIYVIKGNFLRLWFHYGFTNNAYYAMLGAKDAAKEIMNDISSLMDDMFEGVCREYLIHQAKQGKLPFIPSSIGEWWENDPGIKAQDDADVLTVDRGGEEAIFMECKFTSSPMSLEEYTDLVSTAEVFPNIKEIYLCFISKSGHTEPVKRQVEIDCAIPLTIDDLFE